MVYMKFFAMCDNIFDRQSVEKNPQCVDVSYTAIDQHRKEYNMIIRITALEFKSRVINTKSSQSTRDTIAIARYERRKLLKRQ